MTRVLPRVLVGRSLPLAAALFALAACNDDSGPRTPSNLTARSETAVTGVAVGSQLLDPITVRVTASNGSPLGGVAVNFAVAEGGGVVSPAVDTTDNDGLASTRWRLGGTVGTQRVTATVAGVAAPLSFTATTTAGAPSQVAVQAGNNQQALAGAVLATNPAVIVRDAFNNPVAGTSVVFAVASGGGTVSGAGVVTNAQGVATVGEWRLGPTPGTNTLTALVVANGVTANPITFTATAIAGAAASIVAASTTTPSVVVGGTLTPAPGVRVVDAQGIGVPGVAVTFVGSPGSSVVNGSTTTNANGVAAPTSWQLGTTSGTYTLTATVAGLQPLALTATARAAAPVGVSIVAGNNQTAPVGRAVPVDPAVKVSDSFGNGVPGLEVLFEVTGGDGTALVRRPVTDANGVATLGAWLLGDAPGANTLRATVQGVTIANNPVTFTATGAAGQPASLVIQAGSGQTATAGTTVPVAPSVVVRDARGNPVAGITVAFTPGPNSGVVTGGQATTNAAGVATVGSWTLGATSGAQTLVVSLSGLPSVTITATATAGVAARLVASIDSIIPSVAVNNFVTVLPQVRAVDANGNPVAGVTVTFLVKDGAGQLLSGATRVTGTDGLATLTSWRLGTATGVYRIRVLATDLDQQGLEPTFVTIATAGAPTGIAVAASSVATQTATASQVVTTVPIVRVVDQFGNGVPGIAVTFAVSGAPSTIGSGSATLVVNTDNLGFASVGSWTMGAGTGARTLTATIVGSGITGNPVTFTANVP
jgi:adhesin/invasin